MNQPHRARKRFGQHFLVSPDVITDILSAVAAKSDDTIVEIGPGLGAMTAPLAATGATVHAIEIDRDLAGNLRKRYSQFRNVTIHQADALNFDFASLGDSLRIVSNLPYNISTPLLFRLVKFKKHLIDLYLMLQKEVVKRITATPGTRSYGRLSIMLGCHMQVQPLFDVSPQSFAPPPKVTSGVVAMKPLPQDTFNILYHAALSALVSHAFSKRRKTIRNALQGVANAAHLDRAGIDQSVRPQEIPIDRWVALANIISECRHELAQLGESKRERQ